MGSTSRYLKVGLSIVLCFVGVKMLLADVYKVPIGLSLGAIALVVGASVVASLYFPARSAGSPVAPNGDSGSVPGPADAPSSAGRGSDGPPASGAS